MRGRRVALLLTGVLPLLAQDDVPPPTPGDQHDRPPPGPAEALHDDSLSSLPALPLELMEKDIGENGKENNNQEIHVNNDADASEQRTEDAVSGEAAGSGDTGEPPPNGDAKASDEAPIAVDDSESTQQKIDSDPSETSKESAVEESESTVKEQNEEAGLQSSDETKEDTNGTKVPNKENGEASTDGNVEQQQEKTKTDDTPTTDETPSAEEEEEPVERLVVDYASKSAGALILENSPSMKGTSNLLHSDRDKYAIAPCEDKRYVVIGLSEDILVKQVRLANYERYSSAVKEFQIMGSQDMKTWADLGMYKALSQNGEQTFDLVEPSWARYLKFRFLSHHGSEHYCTVSQIKVHGSTMLQGFQEQWRESEAETQSGETVDTASSDGESKQDDRGSTDVDQNSSMKEDGQRSERNEDSASSDQGTESAGEAEASEVSNSDVAEASDSETTSPSGTRETDDSTSPTIDSDDTTTSEVTTDENTQNGESCASHSAKEETEACEPVVPASSGTVKSDEVIGTDTSNSDERGETSLEKNEKRLLQDLDCHVDAGNCSKTSIPDALLGFKFVSDAIKTEALSFASIGLTSRKAANRAGPNVAEQVDTSSFFSHSSKLYSTFSRTTGSEAETDDLSALNELEEMIKTSVEGSHIGSVITRISSKSDQTDDVGSKQDELSATSDSNEQNGESVSSSPPSSGDILPSVENETQPATEAPESEHNHSVVAEVRSQVTEEPRSEADKEGSKSKPLDSTNGVPQLVVDTDVEATGKKMAQVLEKYPSSGCLKDMNFQVFKAKMVSSVARATGGATSGPGKMEPIFKTLTDEIRALQINQSVHDQFTQALVSCYQSILLEVAGELEQVHFNQENRLSMLEDTLKQLKAEKDNSIFQRVASPLLTFGSMFALWLATTIVNLLSMSVTALLALFNRIVSHTVPLGAEFAETSQRRVLAIWKDRNLAGSVGVKMDGKGLLVLSLFGFFILLFLTTLNRARVRKSKAPSEVTIGLPPRERKRDEPCREVGNGKKEHEYQGSSLETRGDYHARSPTASSTSITVKNPQHTGTVETGEYKPTSRKLTKDEVDDVLDVSIRAEEHELGGQSGENGAEKNPESFANGEVLGEQNGACVAENSPDAFANGSVLQLPASKIIVTKATDQNNPDMPSEQEEAPWDSQGLQQTEEEERDDSGVVGDPGVCEIVEDSCNDTLQAVPELCNADA